jgi:hypothetical protein
VGVASAGRVHIDVGRVGNITSTPCPSGITVCIQCVGLSLGPVLSTPPPSPNSHSNHRHTLSTAPALEARGAAFPRITARSLGDSFRQSNDAKTQGSVAIASLTGTKIISAPW